MVTSAAGDDDPPPSEPPPYAGDQQARGLNSKMPSPAKKTQINFQPSFTINPPEFVNTLATSRTTSKSQPPFFPPFGTNRQLKTSKTKSKNKTSSRLPPPTTSVATTPTLTTLVVSKQQLTSENQPSNDLPMPKSLTTGSSNTSSRSTNHRSATASIPATIRGHPWPWELASDDPEQPHNIQ